MRKLPVYILAGGRSTRFGSDKARAMLEGQPLILRVAGMIAAHASRITVVADRDGKYADLGLATIADDPPGHHGPLAGMATALRHAGEESLSLIVSCDLVVIRDGWIVQLLDHADGEVSAVAFRDEKWQPFPGVYHRSALPHMQRQLDTGDRSIQTLLNQLPGCALPLPNDWPTIIQVNRPADLSATARR